MFLDFSAHVESGTRKQLLDSQQNCTATGQKICFNSHMHRYTSNCVYEMCTHTFYDSVTQGTSEAPQCVGQETTKLDF